MNTPGEPKNTYYETHRQEVQKYYEEHKPYILERLKNYYTKNRNIIREKQRMYYNMVTKPKKGYETPKEKTSEIPGGHLEIIKKGTSLTHSKTPISIKTGKFLLNFD